MPSSAELRLEPLAWNFALAGAAYSAVARSGSMGALQLRNYWHCLGVG